MWMTVGIGVPLGEGEPQTVPSRTLIPVRRPVAGSPGASNQRQVTPVTMNEMAIGKRNRLRKKFSPRIPWSSKMASPRPRKMQAPRKKVVKTTVLRMSIWKRGLAKSLA
jgi:hypothetical protein